MDIMKLMKQAKNLKKMQDEITKCEVEDDVEGACLVLSGSGDVKSFKISQELYDKGREAVEAATKKVIASCFKKQIDLYRQKAKDAMGGVDVMGMFK
jgi:DNA-binding protein YbaB